MMQLRNFAVNDGEVILSWQKKINEFILFCSRLFITLEEIAVFLYIKAVWGIEEKLGYELETVLNSTFCYKLHQRTPDAEPATVL